MKLSSFPALPNGNLERLLAANTVAASVESHVVQLTSGTIIRAVMMRMLCFDDVQFYCSFAPSCRMSISI